MDKPRKHATFDPAKDGNVFEWILKQTALDRTAQHDEIANRPKIDWLTGKPFIKPLPKKP